MNVSRLAFRGAVLIMLCGLRVAAQTNAESKAAAEALFRDGKRLMREKNFGEACLAFEKSQKIDPAAGTLINLGECYEKDGKTASAWVTFTEAASAAKKKGQSERAQVAERRASALEPKVPRLTIDVPSDSGVESVTRDTVTVPQVVWGTPLPVDPGEHRIEATGAGKEPWSGTVTVEASENETLTIPALLTKPNENEGSVAKVEAESNEESTAPNAEGSSPGKAQRIIGVAVAGAGVAAMGIGSVIALSAKSDFDDAPGCDGNDCGQAGFNRRNSAIDQAGTATIVFGVGTAALVGGAVLWVLAPSASEEVAIEPAIGPNGVRLTVGRAW